MTITRRLGIGYTVMAAVCLLLLGWLYYHEFVAEPAEFAARGITGVHKDTAAEFFTICFLGAVPVLLAFGWWWTRRVLAPLHTLGDAARSIESHNLRLPLPETRSDDEVSQLTAVLTSMTARLDASFRQIREFTLHASHELKTPLTVMRAQLETVLHEERGAPSGHNEWIRTLLDELQRLAKIVDALTLLSKADAGLITLERRPVNFDELVREAFEDALILAQPRDVRVSLDACATTPIAGDRHRLRQLLLILLDNAVKYNRPGGRIHIALGENGGGAELRITNDGEGVADETRQHLFERFARGENAVGKVEGSGLGLNIARWIVQAHGGQIALHSRPQETTVVVKLPRAQPQVANGGGPPQMNRNSHGVHGGFMSAR